MEPNENNLFREIQEPATSSDSEKRSSRSRVWEKVVWFTRKAKGTKDSKNSSPEVQKNNNNTRVNCGDCKSLEVGKSDCKQKVRKTRSFKYLKRRKVRQFGDDLCSVAVEEDVNLQDCGTATGTFHDFKSERRISRHERATSNSLLSEIARGMNSSQQKVKENVKSVLSLPLDDLSLNEGPVSDSLSPSFPRVRRSVSFSGPAYNSWPRKKRTYLKSSVGIHSVELLSPPMKQKCVSAIRKRASFNGFDSSKINVKKSYLSLFKGVKSTPHLPQGGQIRNQNGLTIGAIHFYKSPAIFQKDDTTLKLFQRRSQPKQTDGKSVTGVHCLTHGSIGEKDGETSTLLSGESDKITYGIPETTEKLDTDVHSNCSLSNEHSSESGVTCKEQIDRTNVNSSCTNNCISFQVKNREVQNATISAFLLEGECSSSCITTSPVDSSDEDLVKGKPLLSFSAPEEMTSVHSTEENILTEDGDINYTVLKSEATCEDGLIKRTSNGSVEAMDIPECYDKAPNFQSNESVLHSSDSYMYQESSHSANVSEVVSANDEIDAAIFGATQCNTQRTVALSSCSLPSVDDSEVSRVNVTHSPLCSNGNLQTSLTGNEMIWQRKPIVNGTQFKKRTEVKANCCVLFLPFELIALGIVVDAFGKCGAIFVRMSQVRECSRGKNFKVREKSGNFILSNEKRSRS